MVDSQNSLWLAKFDIKVNSLPDKFVLPKEIDELIKRPIEVHDFQREFEIVSQFADSVDFTNSIKEKAAREAAATPNAEAAPVVVEAVKKPTHDEIVSEMIAKTKQSEDVCYFYLESVSWDLAAAIELMESMEAR